MDKVMQSHDHKICRIYLYTFPSLVRLTNWKVAGQLELPPSLVHLSQRYSINPGKVSLTLAAHIGNIFFAKLNFFSPFSSRNKLWLLTGMKLYSAWDAFSVTEFLHVPMELVKTFSDETQFCF